VTVAFKDATPLIGVVHLVALPGSPQHCLLLTDIIDLAVADARSYRDGGASGLIIENFGDVPYAKNRVQPQVVAAMTLAVDRVMREVDLPIGINVLRNDARTALGIAAVTGAAFIRVNVHIGATVTDQGLIEGQADQTLRYRALLGTHTEIWADVHVKHGAPLCDMSIEDAAEDTVYRGLADAIIVSGAGTGKETDPEHLARVHQRLPGVTIFVGSGTSPESIAKLMPEASGFIVGTWAKQEGDVRRPVDPRRVARLVEAIRAAATRG
jgi:membrane complex biogenesis BtpA family protein